MTVLRKRVKAGFAVVVPDFVSTTRTVGGSRDEKWSQLEAAKTDVQDFGSEVVVIELPCKVNHSNSAVLLQIDGASAALRYFWILSKENCLHDEALKRCTPRTYLSVDSCEAPQRMSYTSFFFQLSPWPPDCLCSGESYTTAQGTNKNFKSHSVRTQQSQTEGRFFFFMSCFLEAAWVPDGATDTMQPQSFPLV